MGNGHPLPVIGQDFTGIVVKRFDNHSQTALENRAPDLFTGQIHKMDIFDKEIGAFKANLRRADSANLADNRTAHQAQRRKKSKRAKKKTSPDAGKVSQPADEQGDQHHQVVSRFKNTSDPLDVIRTPRHQV